MTGAGNVQAEVVLQATRLVETRLYDPNVASKWSAGGGFTHVTTNGLEADFRKAMRSALERLEARPVGFHHASESAVPLGRLIRASMRRHAGEWVVQDVLPHGPAEEAGMQFGDALVQVNGSAPGDSTVTVRPGEPLTIVIRRECREIVLSPDAPRTKRSVVHRSLPGGIGYVRIAHFPGLAGIDVAREIDVAIGALPTCASLIVDLRGNPGGGSGNLRLMSYLTPERIPVGYSLTRRRKEQGYDRTDLPRFTRIPRTKAGLAWLALRFRFVDQSIAVVTEGYPKQRFHGRVALLVNEHTASGAEIVVGFARDHGLATIYGSRTAGTLLGWRTFPLPGEHRMILPVSDYVTWEGKRFEGAGIEPDVEIPFDVDAARNGIDNQLVRTCESLR